LKDSIKPKKYLGQHFLNDEVIAKEIVDQFLDKNKCKDVLEVGPGMGVLTKYLIPNSNFNLKVIEIDKVAIDYLLIHYPSLKVKIIFGDVLKIKPDEISKDSFAIVGNFPYNISSQILFKVLEHKDRIPYVVGMFQKEVGERIAAPPGSKTYGILSVLMQAYYDVESLMIVEKESFNPPPQVRSVVIRFIKRNTNILSCNETLFIKVVKTAFNQRRKTLRNALKSLINSSDPKIPYLDLRAERLGWQQFEELTNAIEALH
jgi:16S rRNA (adenine1518-N6/adenine1519-N6)-dimethyltransferase